MTGNWDQCAFNLTNTDSWFLGKVDCSTLQGATSDLCTITASAFTYSDYFNQGVNTTSTPTFATVNTGQGAYEL